MFSNFASEKQKFISFFLKMVYTVSSIKIGGMCMKGRISNKMGEIQIDTDVIAKYAPKQMNAEEIKAVLEEKFADVLATKNKGQIMKAVMGELKGKADGKVINQVVAEYCN